MPMGSSFGYFSFKKSNRIPNKSKFEKVTQLTKQKKMDRIFTKKQTVKREIQAISSKSEAHRYLICAALGDGECDVHCANTNEDIEATVLCLNALGACITRTDSGFSVKPISTVTRAAVLECNESGSTLRFLLPTVCALGAICRFNMKGRLADRPLSPLYELLEDSGSVLSPKGSNPLSVKGNLTSGEYSIAADVSSQYISGMLFALSLCEGESRLRLEGKLESEPYIFMTVDALRAFGAKIEFDSEQKVFYIKGGARLKTPKCSRVGGDWSNAAFFLCAGAICTHPVTVRGIDKNSRQGDKEIVEALKKMGAVIEQNSNSVTVYPSKLRGIEIDGSNIPDLIPILAVVASVAEGETKIFNASRLRLKESDRIESVCETLSALGADIRQTEDGMIIQGKNRLSGGKVNSHNDHRIAMSAAVASLVCDGDVIIEGFEAINKSYPTFAENWEKI